MWFHSVDFFASKNHEGKGRLLNILDDSKSFIPSLQFIMIYFAFFFASICVCACQDNWEVPSWQDEFEFSEDHYLSETTPTSNYRPTPSTTALHHIVDHHRKVNRFTTRGLNRISTRQTKSVSIRFSSSLLLSKTIPPSTFPSSRITQTKAKTSKGSNSIPAASTSKDQIAKKSGLQYKIPCNLYFALYRYLFLPILKKHTQTTAISFLHSFFYHIFSSTRCGAYVSVHFHHCHFHVPVHHAQKEIRRL